MRLLLLYTCLIISAASQAQSNKRVIGLSSKVWNGTEWEYADTSSCEYFGSRGHSRLSPEEPSIHLNYDIGIEYVTIADTIAIDKKYLYTYDANDSVTSKTDIKYVNGVWVNDFRLSYVYNTNKQLLVYLYEEWNTNTNVWDSSYRVTYTYTANNLRLSSTAENYTAGSWLGYIKHTNTYDASGNILSITKQDWGGGTWVNDYRNISTYDANNNMLMYTRGVWASNTWMPDTRHTMTYDSNNKQLSYIREIFQNNVWNNTERQTYVRDNNGNPTTHTTEHWDTGAWQNFYRYISTFSSTNKLLSSQSEVADSSGWSVTGRTLYTYNSDDNRTSYVADNWTGTAWELDFKYEYPYDAEGYWLGELTYYPVNGTPELVHEARLFYEEYTPNNISEAVTISSSVYPNPAIHNALLSFDMPQSGNVQWAVYDIHGRQLDTGAQHCISGQQSILLDLTDYAPGIYMYALTTASGKQGQGKIVKQ